tara:strand:- start:1931 stop:2182 length:252 start_codon:yes stop_codon:yes gene_type:complete
MKLLYFGWVRTKIGRDRENLNIPMAINDVAALIEWLKTRGDSYAHALEDASLIRVAVNHEIGTMKQTVTNDDEVALFPPMTGG